MARRGNQGILDGQVLWVNRGLWDSLVLSESLELLGRRETVESWDPRAHLDPRGRWAILEHPVVLGTLESLDPGALRDLEACQA